MTWYCNKCKKLHGENEMCPAIKLQLKGHPEWLAQATNFATVAGENALITSQALNRVVEQLNSVVGTELSYEGTVQFARDVQVFNRLNTEPFKRSGVFSSPESAKSYYENVLKISEGTPRAMSSFDSKLTGYAQEVDWLRMKKGQLSSLWQKSLLLEDNAPGVDGITTSRLSGKELSRTTIKASKNPMTKNSTGIVDVQEAITKGTATDCDIIFGPKGTATAAHDAGLANPVVEKNTTQQIQASNARLKQKIVNGQAIPYVTMQQVGQKATQGAIVGAAVAITISTLSSYVRYKNGELTREEAFKAVSKDTLNGAIVGAGLGAVTIFLPGGIVGCAAGLAIGIYFGKVCTNILDEIYGDGAYGAILDASGYVYGMTINLQDAIDKITANVQKTEANIKAAQKLSVDVQRGFDEFELLKGE